MGCAKSFKGSLHFHELTCPSADARLKLIMLNQTLGCLWAKLRNVKISPVATRAAEFKFKKKKKMQNIIYKEGTISQNKGWVAFLTYLGNSSTRKIKCELHLVSNSLISLNMFNMYCNILHNMFNMYCNILHNMFNMFCKILNLYVNTKLLW